ncbi:I78 family peptidase inhibitor [Erythrobacter ani]|uniref:Lipoprotein n=1 Tax=Erythrobacter ani TaxID=2827235 RepID=A0ABS6SMF4_9SPHN|nr:I78 family peptidase inhibitor [Erythrobacter ani]MBV7266225.1 hypothetical protein [Erythrobacter ani]
MRAAEACAASVLSVLLTGCATPEPSPPSARAQGGEAAVEQFLRANRACKDDELGRFLGMTATEQTISEVKAASGAISVRLLPVGKPVSAEGATGRISIELDEANRISRLYCG